MSLNLRKRHIKTQAIISMDEWNHMVERELEKDWDKLTKTEKNRYKKGSFERYYERERLRKVTELSKEYEEIDENGEVFIWPF